MSLTELSIAVLFQEFLHRVVDPDAKDGHPVLEFGVLAGPAFGLGLLVVQQRLLGRECEELLELLVVGRRRSNWSIMSTSSSFETGLTR